MQETMSRESGDEAQTGENIRKTHVWSRALIQSMQITLQTQW